MNVTPPSAAASRIARLVGSSHCRPNVMVPRQMRETTRPVCPRFTCCTPGAYGRLVEPHPGGTVHEDTYTIVEDVTAPGEPGDDHHLVDYQTQELVSRLWTKYLAQVREGL